MNLYACLILYLYEFIFNRWLKRKKKEKKAQEKLERERAKITQKALLQARKNQRRAYSAAPDCTYASYYGYR